VSTSPIVPGPSESRSEDSRLSPRVAALEVGVRSLSNELESVKGSVDRLSSNVMGGFAEIRRDLGTSGRTNWGWVIAGTSALIAVVGAIGSSWVRPLQQTDEFVTRRLDSLESNDRENRESVVRADERLRVYREVGVIPARAPGQ